MGDNISTLGWVLIILVIVLTISLNLSLFIRRKHKGNAPDWTDRMRDVRKTVKDPFWLENEKMQELSNRLDKIKNEKNSAHHENHNFEKENGK